jgi:hypothetical protein
MKQSDSKRTSAYGAAATAPGITHRSLGPGHLQLNDEKMHADPSASRTRAKLNRYHSSWPRVQQVTPC